MPNPSEYDSQEAWMSACVPIRKNEGDSQERAVAACLNIWKQHQEGKSMDMEQLVAYGGQLKALGKGRIGGYLIRYTSDDDPDLEGDFFTKDTYYGPHKTTPVFYHHGQDGVLKLRRLQEEAEIVDDEYGKWVEAQLSLRDQYEQWIYGQADEGKMGWSSGTAPHLVEREPVGKAYWIKAWPLGVDATLTPIPAEPRNVVQTYKSYLKSLADALGVWLADAPTEAAPEAPGGAVAVVGKRHTYLFMGGKQ